jgi:hypothetical protein
MQVPDVSKHFEVYFEVLLTKKKFVDWRHLSSVVALTCSFNYQMFLSTLCTLATLTFRWTLLGRAAYVPMAEMLVARCLPLSDTKILPDLPTKFVIKYYLSSFFLRMYYLGERPWVLPASIWDVVLDGQGSRLSTSLIKMPRGSFPWGLFSNVLPQCLRVCLVEL